MYIYERDLVFQVLFPNQDVEQCRHFGGIKTGCQTAEHWYKYAPENVW